MDNNKNAVHVPIVKIDRQCGMCEKTSVNMVKFLLTSDKMKWLCDSCLSDAVKKRRARNQRKRYRQNIAKRGT